MNPIAQFIEAARFLTRIPLASTHQKTISLSETFSMFPVVGIMIGGFSGLLLCAGMIVGLPPFLSAIIAVGGTILLTGGLHEDGLGDVADGFGGGRTKQDKLKIMRDSRVGSYGVLCLVLSVAARLGALATLVEKLPLLFIVCILIASAALSRGLMVSIITILSPARKEGLSAALSPPLARSLLTCAVAGAITTVALWPVMSVFGILITLLITVIATGILAILAFRQIGGHTGDVAGAAQQIAEIACLFAVVTLV